MDILQIVIHKKLIDSFKKKAIAVMPSEHIVGIMGEQKDTTLYIYDFIDMNISKREFFKKDDSVKIIYDRLSEDIEAGNNFKYFGTLHSHPDWHPIPSQLDISTFYEHYNDIDNDGDEEWEDALPDTIMGIMQVNNKKKVTQYSLVFYNIDMNQIELLISEDK